MKIMEDNAKKVKDPKTRKVLINFTKNLRNAIRKDDLEDMIATKAATVD